MSSPQLETEKTLMGIAQDRLFNEHLAESNQRLRTDDGQAGNISSSVGLVPTNALMFID
jgi:hypothetical protein